MKHFAYWFFVSASVGMAIMLANVALKVHDAANMIRQREINACEAKGGFLVDTESGMACIDRKVLL